MGGSEEGGMSLVARETRRTRLSYSEWNIS
jgi:hypothetical protein